MKCFQKAAAQGTNWRWPDKPDEEFHQIGDVEQEIETPLDIRSSSSSSRSSTFLSELLNLTICISRYILCSLLTIFFNKFCNWISFLHNESIVKSFL